MASAYARLRINWGGIDFTAAQQETPSYSSTQIVSGGNSAMVNDGIGARRATLVIDRAGQKAGADVATMHFDWMNTTGGSPDDTWTSSDYAALEALIVTWWTNVRSHVPLGNYLKEINWHRVGTGVSKPNPAERQLIVSPVLAGQGDGQFPPQVACSITFRTAVRKSWGRTYLPWGKAISTDGQATTAACDAIASYTNTLVTGAAAADFHLVVISKTLHSTLNVEKLEVDTNLDVIRRRRWKQSSYRKILP